MSGLDQEPATVPDSGDNLGLGEVSAMTVRSSWELGTINVLDRHPQVVRCEHREAKVLAWG